MVGGRGKRRLSPSLPPSAHFGTKPTSSFSLLSLLYLLPPPHSSPLKGEDPTRSLQGKNTANFLPAKGQAGEGRGGGEWSAATHRRLTLSGVFFVDPQEGGRKERNRGVKWAESRRRRGGQTAFSSFLLEAAPSPALFPCVSRTGRKGLPGEREEGVENPCTFLPSSLFARRVEQA